MNLEESKQNYLNKHNAIKETKAKIKQREMQIERLKKKLDKQWDNSWWGEILIRPIMEMVKAKFLKLTWDDERLIPLGLCSRVSVFGHIGDKTVCMIAFTPSNLNEGIIAFDTGEKKGSYPQGSIGDLNGFQNVSEDIHDIEQIYKHIEKQLNEK